jgi:hypothetical protein
MGREGNERNDACLFTAAFFFEDALNIFKEGHAGEI